MIHFPNGTVWIKGSDPLIQGYRDNGSFYTEEDAAAFQERKNQYNGQMLTSVMMEDAEVVDHRARFFFVYLWV